MSPKNIKIRLEEKNESKKDAIESLILQIENFNDCN